MIDSVFCQVEDTLFEHNTLGKTQAVKGMRSQSKIYILFGINLASI